MEYGKNYLSIQSNALKKFNSFVIVDDLLATGGKVGFVSRLLQDQKREIIGLIAVLELKELGGRLKFESPFNSMILLCNINKKISCLRELTPLFDPKK